MVRVQCISRRLRIVRQRSLHAVWVEATLRPLELLGLNLGLNECPQEIVVVFVEQGLTKLGVFDHKLLGKVVKLVLAIEEEQVLEGLRRE